MKKPMIVILVGGGILLIAILFMAGMGVVQTIYAQFYGGEPVQTVSGDSTSRVNTIARCGLPRWTLLQIESVLPYDPHKALYGETYVDYPLLAAMNNYHKGDFKKLLDGGADPNGTKDVPILDHAANHCDLWFMQQLLVQGADPNGKRYGPKDNPSYRELGPETPLELTSLMGDEDAASMLINAGADVNLINASDDEINANPIFLSSVPLEPAAEVDNWKMFMFFIDHGASPVLNEQVVKNITRMINGSRLRLDMPQGKTLIEAANVLKEKWPVEYGNLNPGSGNGDE